MRYLMFAISYVLVGLAAAWVATSLTQRDNAGEVSGADAAPLETIRTVIRNREVAAPVSETGSIESQTTIFRQQYVAHLLAAEADTTALIEYLDRYVHSRDHFFSNNITYIFLERLIEVDVQLALRYSEDPGLPSNIRQRLLMSVMTTWARHDPAAAVAYLANISNLETKNTIGAMLLEDSVFGATNHVAEVEQLLGPYGQRMSNAIRTRRQAPDVVFEEALNADGARRIRLMSTAIARWWSLDPDAALARVTTLSGDQERSQLLRVIVNMQGQTDPMAALELARLYAPDDPELEGRAVSQLVARDPAAGITYMEEYISRTGNRNIITNVMSQWAEVDIDGAIAYAETLDESYNDVLIHTLVPTYLSKDAEAAMRWVMGLDNAEALQRAVQYLPHQNMTAAEYWLDRIDDEGLSSTLLSAMATAKAQRNASSAIDWLNGHENHPGYHAAMSDALGQLSHRNPEQGAEFLVAHASDDRYSSAFMRVASQWARQDLEAALDWATSLGNGPNKSAALSTMVSRVVQTDRELAVLLLDELDGAYARNARMQIAHQWLAMSPGDLDQIIRRLGLSQSEAASLGAGRL